jgi:hypothetical protein
MTEVSQEIREQIKQAVTGGDLKRLKSLAKQFPDSFASFGGGQPKDNLADLAWKKQKHDVLIWLVVEKGLEASTRLETSRGIVDYVFDDPEERYHKTAEVLVASMFNKNRTSGGDCRTVQYWADYPTIDGLGRIGFGVNPQFIHQVQSGNFRKFVAKMASDSRAENIDTAHSAEMFGALAHNIDKIEEVFRAAHMERNKLAAEKDNKLGRSPD